MTGGGATLTAATDLLDRLLPAREGGDAAARGWLAAHGLPDPRDEAWRYTPVDRIVAALEAVADGSHRGHAPVALAPALVAEEPPHRGDRMVLAPGLVAVGPQRGGDESVVLDPALVDHLAGDLGGVRLVFVDGVFVAGLSTLDALRPGLHCSASGAGANHGPALPAPDELARFDGFQALNRAAADTATIGVDPGVAIDDPVHVVHLATGRLAHPRTVVTVGDSARLALVETFVGLAGGQGVTNASSTVIAGPEARVVHHRIQDEPPAALHVGHTRVVQAAGSYVRSVSVMLGAAVGRHALDVDLRGEGATADLGGVYLPTGAQRHDNLVTVEHSASHGTSRQSFRAVVDDAARGSFGGHVIVPPGTVGTDAHQSNRNLLLTPTAQADTRPWLEILADDVACTHGATVGRLDDDALFYLRSRGIPRDGARAMLVAAFVAEITDSIEPPALRRLVEAAVAARRGTSAPALDPDPGEMP